MFEIFFYSFYLYRQKNIERQLEKITDLVRLIVQKMEIPAEMEDNDTSETDKNENWIKLRQTFNITRQFAQIQSTTSDSLSHEFHHIKKV